VGLFGGVLQRGQSLGQQLADVRGRRGIDRHGVEEKVETGLMKAGCVLSSLTLPMASRSVPSASGLAGLLKPIWLSLIRAKVKAEASAASASPSKLRDFGTPPDSVHKTP
jgi:hypothetical protein